MMHRSSQRGFSLLEVIFALMIITTLSISLTTLLRGSFDIRQALGENDQAIHRLSTAMSKIANDLQHAYVLSEKDLGRYGDSSKRKIKSLFELTLGNSGGDVLRFTSMSHVPLMKNANESDTTFVVYRLEEDKESGRTNLMRGESKRVPDDFRENPPMRLLAKEIKTLRFRAWNGDEWMRDGWDSTRRETKGLLPRMVQVEIEAYTEPAEARDVSARTLSTENEPAIKMLTAIYVPNATIFPELKTGSNTIRWDRL